MTGKDIALRALVDHFGAMQGRMRAYLQREIEADAFIGEIVEALDGPEQRRVKRLVEAALQDQAHHPRDPDNG